MKKISLRIIIFITLLCLFLPSSLFAGAASELPRGLIIVDSDGISVGTDGRYFLKASELRPGDLLKKNVSVQNLRPEKAFALTMQTEPTSNQGNIDLFKEVEITIFYGGKEIYKGSADGQGTIDLTKPLTLDTFFPNQTGSIEILINFKTQNREMLIPGDYGRVTFNFIFTAMVDENYKPPKTGLTSNTLMYFAIGIICFTCFVLLIIKHKREKAAKKDVAL